MNNPKTYLDAFFTPAAVEENGGAPLLVRPTLNFVAGPGVTIVATDDPVNEATVVTITASGGGAGALYGAYSARPAAGTSGRIYVCSDGLVAFVDDGAHWRPLVRGVAGTEVAPGNSIAGLSQVGEAPTKTNVEGGCLYMFRSGGDGDKPGGYELARTGTQTVTAHIVPQIYPDASNNVGQVGTPALWVRDPSGGRLAGLFLGDSGYDNGLTALNVYEFASLTAGSVASNPAGGIIHPMADGIWLQIAVSGGGSVSFNFSFDGRNFETLYTDSGPYVPSGGSVAGVGYMAAVASTGLLVDSLLVV